MKEHYSYFKTLAAIFFLEIKVESLGVQTYKVTLGFTWTEVLP